MEGQSRSEVKIGSEVGVVLKEDQRSGKITEGIVKDILTNSSFHPHGIKVRLTSGEVGRVKTINKPERQQ
ncbi:MAG: YwbE family protein [Prolixibacteraceae bacterium]